MATLESQIQSLAATVATLEAQVQAMAKPEDITPVVTAVAALQAKVDAIATKLPID